MEKFWNWLVTSSANPSEIALTVKGGLGVVVTIVLAISPILHLHVGSDQLNAVVDLIVQIAVVGAGVISAIATIGGLARKIFLTLKSPTPPTRKP